MPEPGPANALPDPALVDQPLRPDDPPMTLVEHLTELRARLIVSLSCVAAGTVVTFHWSGRILEFLALPVGGLVFTGPTDAFVTRLKIALFGGFLLSLPAVLHQAWLFVARALDESWRRPVRLLTPVSYLLFVAGMALAYFVVLPAAMRFLLACGSESVKPLLTVGSYVGFAASLCLSFGAVFQLPLVLFVLNRAGLVSRGFLASRRGYAYILAFLAAAVLTPGPDVFSQVALAVPTLVLFEITLLALR
ncbi:MAG: twin-arginine translocase subunit TatC [Elusimicrobia bacterium]|nr:twin-arginine translocase subunit TatC [Elusimicrobiota bacterium]